MRRCFVRGMHALQECDVLCVCVCLTPCAASGGASNVVDILNVTAGTWSTTNLSAVRYDLAATSLPNVGVAIFAGGQCTCSRVHFRIFASCVVRVEEWDG